MGSKPTKHWVLESAKPASDGRHKQLSGTAAKIFSTVAAVKKKKEAASGIVGLLMQKPVWVRGTDELLKRGRYKLALREKREPYDSDSGAKPRWRDDRIAVINASESIARAVMNWIASPEAPRPITMNDVWGWIAGCALVRTSPLCVTLRADRHVDLGDAALDRSERWWRDILAKKEPFKSIKQEVARILRVGKTRP